MDDRRDDWRHGVDENLASLNSGARVWEREMKVIRKLLGEFDRLLRGDPEKDTDGMVARVHAIENEMNLLKAVVLKDKTGGKGLVGRVEEIERGERTSDRRLKVWVAFIGLVSAILVAAASNLDRLQAFWNRKSTDPVERAIERAKRPKARKKTVIFREIPGPSTETDQSGVPVP